MTQFKHVSRHVGAKSRKQKPKNEKKKTVLVMWSKICLKKCPKLLIKFVRKKLFPKFGLQAGIFWPLRNL